MITRRRFSQGAPAILLQRTPRQPNLLFLMADDHAAYVTGADGNRQCETPHLDQLASEGACFASHYCNSPVCTPSRQSLFTGQMPHAAGVTRLATPLATGKPTLARQLKAAGYTTAVFGKMHFNRPGTPGLHGFDVIMTEGEVTKAWNALPAKPVSPDVPVKRLPWRPFQTPAEEWLNAGNLPYPRFDDGMRGSFIVREASRFLRENRDRPFALWVSLMEPHSPFDYPVEDRGHFDPKRLTVPEAGPEDAWQIPLIFRGLTPEQKRGITAAYYSSARFLDRNMGRVLTLLKDLRLDENTLTVYTADHGYCLGHHGRFEKHCGYDPALRVPLIMRWPGRIGVRTVTDLTEHIDLGPTLLELLGAPPFAVQHGQSLRPYLEGRTHPARRDHIVSEYLENEEVFVRTERYKLIFGSGRRERQDGYKTDNPKPGRYVRLFDLRNDPGEFRNVAGSHPDIVSRLEQLALRRFRQTHPDAEKEPAQPATGEALEYYLPPRDQVAPV
ncbi:MAG: sulfatase-like hydrolase/transferase [Bryobacterales bacterium]|nr:sulfatase-like hydrolase/transferase [Bryobacterales bacterium]